MTAERQHPETVETAFVVFSTHWDREWVQPFEQYRYRLVNLIDGLLDILRKEPEIRFFFDGQSVFLEDYLAVRPENKAELQAYANERRLIVGPWYVLADQFLESAEATVRNLLIGRKTASEFGGAASVGYVPDSFGSIASLPAILNGFGIRSASFGRGRAHLTKTDGILFWWQSQDGARVLALSRGYGNAISLSYPDIWRDVQQYLPTPETARAAAEEILAPERADTPIPLYYLSAGIDHMEMHPGMAAIVAALNAGQSRTQFVISDPQRYLEAAERYVEQKGILLPVVEGEMRGDAGSPMDLQGVLSTNQEVKRTNRRCEILLTSIAEPLSAIAQRLDGISREHHLSYAWKTLLKNHPHDSICACSTDGVMADVMGRFRSVLTLSDIFVDQTLRRLTSLRREAADQSVPLLTLFNPTPERHISSFEMRVRLPARLESERYVLVDATEKIVGEAQRIAVKNIDLESVYATNEALRIMLSKDSPAERDPNECYTVLDVAGACDFGASLGFQTLKLVSEQEHARTAPTDLTLDSSSLSNSLIRLSAAADGTVDLTDLTRKKVFSCLGWLEDTADLGDTYDYAALNEDLPLTTRGKQAVSVVTRRVSPHLAEMEVTMEMLIPADSSSGGRGPVKAHKIVTVFQVVSGSSRVLARTQYVNASIHHRLRAAFSFRESSRAFTGGHFTAVERGWTATGQPFPCRPFTDFIHLAPGEAEPSGGGFGLWAQGMYECELRSAGREHQVFLTLCRSVTAIGAVAGANYAVTHAQELGAHVAEYAFGPSSSLSATMHQAAAYLCPVIGEAHFAALDHSSSLGDVLSVSPAEIVFTCLKRAMDGHGTIARVFNSSSVETLVSLVYDLPFSSVSRVDLSETELPADGAINRKGPDLRFLIGPYETATLRIAD